MNEKNKEMGDGGADAGARKFYDLWKGHAKIGLALGVLFVGIGAIGGGLVGVGVGGGLLKGILVGAGMMGGGYLALEAVGAGLATIVSSIFVSGKDFHLVGDNKPGSRSVGYRLGYLGTSLALTAALSASAYGVLKPSLDVLCGEKEVKVSFNEKAAKQEVPAQLVVKQAPVSMPKNIV